MTTDFFDFLESQTDVVESVPDAKVVGCMAIGNDSYRIRVSGEPEHMRGRVYQHRPDQPLYEDLFDVGVVGGIPVPTGLTVLIGPADVGKTPILKYVTKALDGELIRVGEPLPGYSRDTSAIASRMLRSEKRVVGVDSFKNIISRLSGNATVSGISRELYPWLSDMSSFFAERGQSVVTVMNISTTDQRVVESVTEALRSNTTAIWEIGADSIRWQARAGEGKKRRTGTASIIWGSDGVVDRIDQIGRSAANEGGRTNNNYLRGMPIDLKTTSSSALSRIVRRVSK